MPDASSAWRQDVAEHLALAAAAIRVGLLALVRGHLSPLDALREAIRIAASFDPGTGGPVDVVALATQQPERSTVYISREELLAPLPPEEGAKLKRRSVSCYPADL